jgi:hypothetical protein
MWLGGKKLFESESVLKPALWIEPAYGISRLYRNRDVSGFIGTVSVIEQGPAPLPSTGPQCAVNSSCRSRFFHRTATVS